MITVITEATNEPITLTEAKDWLGVQGTAHDTKLTAGIKAAREKVEQLSGRSMVARTLKLTLHDYEGSFVDLPYPVINAVVSVKTNTGGTESTITATDYYLSYNRLIYEFSGEYEITYSTVANNSEFYKLAIKKQLAYDYRNEFTENGFDKEVLQMLSSATLNVGY